MSFIFNTFLAAVTAAILLFVGFRHYDADRFEATMRPLSASYELRWKDIKAARAQAISAPKIVLVGGTGSLFGLRCAVFTQQLGLPCVNASLPGQPGLDNLLGFSRSLLRPGDLVLMQLDDVMYVKPPVAPPTVASRQLFGIDFRYLLTAAAERLLASTGYSFFGPIVATQEGDRRGHGRATATAYAETRARQTGGLGEGAVAPATRERLAAFFAWAKDNRIRVVGTAPPTYDDWPVPASRDSSIRQVYADAGLPFIELPNRARYPRDCFWDAAPRLNEECQAQQSKSLAEALAPLLAKR